MRRSLVVVLYVHSLFGQGICRLLRSDKALHVTCLPAEDEAALVRLKCLRPRAVVIEASQDGAVWEALKDLAPPVVIRVSLNEPVMDIYHGHQSLPAGPDTLVEAIHSGLSRRAS